MDDSIPQNTPTELEINLAGNFIRRRQSDVYTGFHILMIAHPDCHFAVNAISAIANDPELKALILPHLKILAPQDYIFDPVKFSAWNQTHPGFEIAVAYKENEWKDINYWGMPTFYFFKDGFLKQKIVGWPSEGNKDELLNTLRVIKSND